MAYLGSAAYRLDGAGQRRDREVASPSFDVIEGGGADARVRQGVSSSLVSRLKLAILLTSAFVAIGVARVGITAMTVGELAENVTLEGQIADAETANSDLRIGRSILSSSARIDRISVQNYGMVYAPTRDVIVLPAEQAASDDGADADADASAQDPDGAAGEVRSDDPEAPKASTAS